MSSVGGAGIESRLTKFGLRCEIFGGHFYRDGMEYREVRHFHHSVRLACV